MKKYRKWIAVFGVMAFLVQGFSNVVYAAQDTKNQYWPNGPEILSAAGIVMEASTGTILYEKNIHDQHYPASITKILTTLLVLENSSMDEIVTFSNDAVHKTEGSGIARDVGEQMTMEQCLYGVMLASGNECAYAVAEHVGGDIGNFIQMMNDRAAQIGCQDSHFNNCNGLPDEQHFTSAYDMALIAREAYKNEAFRIICGSKTYTIPFTNKHTDEETYLQNHHQMLYPYRTRQYLYDYCLGGKTGYTSVANNTLVTYAEKDGITLICVVMDATAGGHYTDTRALFDFCFDNFKLMNVSDYETAYLQQSQDNKGVIGRYEPFVALDPASSIILPITAEFTETEPEIVYSNEDDDVAGSIRYSYAGRLVGEVDITATNAAVEAFPFGDGDGTEMMMDDDAASDDKVEEPQDQEIFQVDMGFVFMAIAAVAILGLLLFLIWKFVDNFYLIKRKLHIRKKEKSPYKTIKQNKMYRKKRHKFF